MKRPVCLLIAGVLLAGCGGGSNQPPAPTGEKDVDLGVIESLGQSKLTGFAGRRVVLIVPAREHAAFTAKLAAEKDSVLHGLLFDLASAEDLDASDEAAVAQFVRNWIHERYYQGSSGQILRVELRQDKR